MHFSFESLWGGSCGLHGKSVLRHSLRHTQLLVDSDCKRWNLEHVVLDLFSHFTLGKIQWLSHVVLDLVLHSKTVEILWLSVSCQSSGFCDLFQLFALFAQLFVVAVDHVRICQRRSGFRHPRGRAAAHQVLGSCAILEQRIGDPASP